MIAQKSYTPKAVIQSETSLVTTRMMIVTFFQPAISAVSLDEL